MSEEPKPVKPPAAISESKWSRTGPLKPVPLEISKERLEEAAKRVTARERLPFPMPWPED